MGDPDTRLLRKLALGRLVQPLMDVDEPARKREFAGEGLLSPLDEQGLESAIDHREHDEVDGDPERRVNPSSCHLDRKPPRGLSSP